MGNIGIECPSTAKVVRIFTSSTFTGRVDVRLLFIEDLYMSAHVLLNLLNKLWKRDKMRGLPSISSFFLNDTIQEHECQILFII